jgi:hypothetical protein
MNGLNGLHGFMLGAPPPVQARAKRSQNPDHILHKIILNFVLLNHNQFSTLRGKGLRVLHPSHPATFWRHVLFKLLLPILLRSFGGGALCFFVFRFPDLPSHGARLFNTNPQGKRQALEGSFAIRGWQPNRSQPYRTAASNPYSDTAS